MIKILLFTLSISTLANYYASINPNSASFRQDLKRLISDQKVLSYNDVWRAFFVTDIANTTSCKGGIEDVYSSKCWKPQKEQCGTYKQEGDCYNREHGWPKSWWGGNDLSSFSDIHHLFPTDGYVNGRRGNFPYDEVIEPYYYTSSNQGIIGTCKNVRGSSRCFQPSPTYRGDLARALFYMSLRYEDVFKCCDVEGVDAAKIKPEMKKTLLKWSKEDPVSMKEQFRNEKIFSFQRNRNPFVDHPEWIESLINI